MLKAVLRRLTGATRSWSVAEVRDFIDRGDFVSARNAVAELYQETADRAAHATCLHAELDFHADKDSQAEAAFRGVLREKPGFPPAHFGLSLLLLERGHVEQALEHAQFAKVADPSEARHWAQMGLCQLRLKNYALAEPLLMHAVNTRSTDAYAWNNLGVVLVAKGEPAEAKLCFERALKYKPEFARAKDNIASLDAEIGRAGLRLVAAPASNLGDTEGTFHEWGARMAEVTALRKAGENEQALSAVEALCNAWPDDEILVCRACKVYIGCGDYQGGIDLLKAFVHRHPSSGPALLALGETLLGANDHKAALSHLESALELCPPTADLHTALASAYFKLEQYEKAHEHFTELVALEPSDSSRFKLASSLVSLCRYPEAIAMFEGLLERGELKRDHVLPNYSYALMYDGQVSKAETYLGELLAAQPNEPNLRTARFVARMLSENYAEGWDDYAFRSMSFSRNFRVLPFPKWGGESLTGKKIIVLAEQGLGDQVMFASCLPDLLALKPQRVVVEVISRVAPTLVRSFPECEFIASNQKSDMAWAKDLGDMDYVVPAGDLPLHFRRFRSSFPAKPYLVADFERVEFWRAKLAQTGPRPWVGMSWRGGTQLTRTLARSMGLPEAMAMRNRLGGTLVCLQYGDVLADLRHPSADGLAYWSEAVSDLDEFSALISALDMVISVCNTTIHYAGALGKPVWVLAPKVPEWRYGLNTTHLPWYPHARVIRQAEHGNWGPVIEAAADEAAVHWARTGNQK